MERARWLRRASTLGFIYLPLMRMQFHIDQIHNGRKRSTGDSGLDLMLNLECAKTHNALREPHTERNALTTAEAE